MSSQEKEVLKTKICCSCLKQKTIENFWKNTQIKGGRDNKCKMCKVQGKFCVKKELKRPNAGRPKKSNAPQLFNVKKEDWVETFIFLKKIGYDLSGHRTIHEQFCEKHHITPKNRTYEKSIQYTPKDLGLV